MLRTHQAAGVTYYPDPGLSRPGEINHNDSGLSLSFLDPAGHGMEIITRPYGSVGAEGRPPERTLLGQPAGWLDLAGWGGTEDRVK